ncbi:MAG: universal stress protein [Planctomycetota bacterium]|nr:universal stress protein [Planctomycetota bacterium]
MLPRFQHLLVPLDFTEKNTSALEVAFEIAVHNRARVTLLHVVEPIPAVDAELRKFVDQLAVRADSELEVRAQRFSQAGIAVETKVHVGPRLREIVQASLDRAADLIVMSSHAVDPSRPVQSWNTLSYQVSVLCSCPILLVK